MDMTNKHKARQILTATLKVSDTTNPLIRVKYTDRSKDATAPKPYCTMIVDNNGDSGSSKLIVKLRVGASSTSYDEYQFSATGVVVANASADSVTNYTCTTLASLVASMNLVDGIFCARVDGPADYTLDSDDFIDQTDTRLGPFFLDTFHRDVSENSTYSCRIGVPSDAFGKLGNGSVEIVFVRAYLNNGAGTDTDTTLKISRDPSDSASDEVELPFTRAIADAAWVDAFSFGAQECGPVFQGPLLVEVTSAASTVAADGVVMVGYRSVEY